MLCLYLKVQGTEEVTSPGGHPYLSFTGIPYAQPPTGPLRWLPCKALCDTLVSRFQRPVPVVPWSGVEGGREVECAQEVTGVERLLPWGPEVRGEEDCLVINVYTPTLDGARPVMVFIHGGGYYAGGGAHL